MKVPPDFDNEGEREECRAAVIGLGVFAVGFCYWLLSIAMGA